MGLLTSPTVKKFEFPNPRWRTAAVLKTVKLPYLCNHLPIWWNLARWRTLAPYSGLVVKILNFWKFKMAAAAIWNIRKIAISPQWFDRSLRNLVLLTAPTVKKNRISQIQDGGRPPFWKKPLNRHISATVWPIFIRLGIVTHIGLIRRIYR